VSRHFRSSWFASSRPVTTHASSVQCTTANESVVGSRSQKRQWLIAALVTTCVMPLGCTPEKPASEVSAASSGFKPAEAPANKAAASPASTPTEATPSASVASAQKSDAVATKSAPSPTNATPKPNAPSPTATAGGPTPAAALPTFNPGQVDPSIAGKAYMKLEMTQSQDPVEILRFIGLIDKSLQELQQDAARRLVNSDLVLDRGMAVARMKLTASERLAKLATSPDEVSKGLIGKMEALGQMAQFKDVPSADELRVVAKDLAKSDDARVARQARRMELMMALTDYQNQSATVESIVEISEDLLSKLDTPEPSIFMAIAQAAQLLDTSAAQELQEGQQPQADDPRVLACDKLVSMLEDKYRDVANPQLGMAAWQMKIQRLPDFESYLQVLDTRQAMSANPETVSAAAKSLMEKLPSPWTAMALIQVATQFEYSGNVPLAKQLLEISATQMATTKTPELREQIDVAMKGFEARTGIIGKPLALDSLVDTDGKPFDVSKYEGKVVLVDFWATWCGPCIAEIPNIQKVYEAKNAEGFDVIAINLDDKRADLDLFLSQQKTPWSVFVSGDPNKVGMESPLAQSLAITAIPFTIVIGRDGNVAAVHVRGAALETKVTELLATTPK
jgi:thiol-disulfide isomerase/thioredoxin